MRNSVFLFPSILIFSAGCAHGQTRNAAAAPAGADHINRPGMPCDMGSPCTEDTIDSQTRNLIAHWPRDFEIATVETTEEPKCRRLGDSTDCTVRVKPIDLILGHREAPYDGSRRSKSWTDTYVISYLFRTQNPTGADNPASNVSFDVRQGDRLIAFLTPAIQQRGKPLSYIATRLDRANDALVETVSRTVAETLAAGVKREPGK